MTAKVDHDPFFSDRIPWGWRLGLVGVGCCLVALFLVRDLHKDNSIWKLVPATVVLIGPYLILSGFSLLARKPIERVAIACTALPIVMAGILLWLNAPYGGIETLSMGLYVFVQFALALISAGVVARSRWSLPFEIGMAINFLMGALALAIIVIGVAVVVVASRS